MLPAHPSFCLFPHSPPHSIPSGTTPLIPPSVSYVHAWLCVCMCAMGGCIVTKEKHLAFTRPPRLKRFSFLLCVSSHSSFTFPLTKTNFIPLNSSFPPFLYLFLWFARPFPWLLPLLLLLFLCSEVLVRLFLQLWSGMRHGSPAQLIHTGGNWKRRDE